MTSLTTVPNATALISQRAEIVNAGLKILEVLNVPNTFSGGVPPFNNQQDIETYLRILPNQPFLEGWFVNRLGTRFPDEGGISRYIQLDTMMITGVVWHSEWSVTYRYLQRKVDQLTRILEKNKSYVKAVNEVLSPINTTFTLGEVDLVEIGGTSYLGMYRSDTRFTLEIEQTEPAGSTIS